MEIHITNKVEDINNIKLNKTFIVVGGIVGWALSEAGSKGVEVIQDIKGSTIINDYPLEDNQ